MKEDLRGYFHLLWLVGIVLCAIAAVFCTLFVSCSKAPDSADSARPAAADVSENAAVSTSDSTPEPTPVPTEEPSSTELGPTEDMGAEYLSRFIFLGDSTTYGMGYYEVMPWSQVWTNELGTMDLSAQSYVTIEVYHDDGSSQTMTIREAVTSCQPEYLVITLGLNGISYMEESDFKEEYTDLVGAIQSLSPDTKIICHSMYPVIDSQAPSGIDNERINRANTWICDIAAATGARYLNSHDILIDESGSLREDYCNGDGVHLSPEGFDAVLMNIRTHGYL